MKRLTNIFIYLFFGILIPLQIQADDWFYPTNLPDGLSACVGSAMCSGLHEGIDGALYVIVPIPEENTTRFYSYDLHSSQWSRLPDLPLGPSNSTSGIGANLCYYYSSDPYYHGHYIFCTKGNSTNEFWRYNISDGLWRLSVNLPGPITSGFGMALETGDTFRVMGQPFVNIYLLKGCDEFDSLPDFYSYQFSALPEPNRGGEILGAWKRLADFWHLRGAELTYQPRENKLYASKSTAYTPLGFYRYDITTNVWIRRADKLAQEGSALATWGVVGHEVVQWTLDTMLFALQGGATNEFDKYRISINEWRYAEDPSSQFVFGVYYGSDLAGAQRAYGGGGLMWAIFGLGHGGNNTVVGAYDPFADDPNGEEGNASNLGEQKLVLVSPSPVSKKVIFRLLTPNTANSNVEVFDNTGKLVYTSLIPIGTREVAWEMKTNEGKIVSSGIYLYVVKTDNKIASGKLVIQR